MILRVIAFRFLLANPLLGSFPEDNAHGQQESIRNPDEESPGRRQEDKQRKKNDEDDPTNDGRLNGERAFSRAGRVAYACIHSDDAAEETDSAADDAANQPWMHGSESFPIIFIDPTRE